jgi:hypothetical protein
VEYARDLGQVELWEESLRRSLERRGRPRRSSVELYRLKPARDLMLADVIERSAHYSQLRRRAVERHAIPRPSAALGGVSAMALLAAATVPKLIGGGGDAHQPIAGVQEAAAAATPVSSPAHAAIGPAIPRPAVHPPRLTRPVVSHRAAVRPATVQHSAPAPTHSARAATSTPQATIASVSHGSGGAGLTAAPKHTVAKPRAAVAHPTPSAPAHHSTTTSDASTTSHTSGGAVVKPKAKATPTTPTNTSAPTAPPVSSGSYVNPLAHASLTPERIDQGVDYSGSGTLTALGAGRVTYVGTSGTGWPGAFIEYRLTSGADAGRYVYYAEGVSPRVHVGQTLQPGQSVATMSGGIEIGWGSGVGTQPLAQAEGQWSSGSDSGMSPALLDAASRP